MIALATLCVKKFTLLCLQYLRQILSNFANFWQEQTKCCLSWSCS